MTYGRNGLNTYQQVNNQSANYADPHLLIQMLMEAFLMRVANAHCAIEQNAPGIRGTEVGKAITILSGLRDTLDMNKGGEMASNLEALYAYMQGRLLDATRQNDTTPLAEVSKLMREIKSGWDGIREQAAGSEASQNVGATPPAGGLSVTS